jgi:hypothetical protein
MPRKARWFNPKNHKHLKEGVVWVRTHGDHEPAVKIIKCVYGRAGDRFLVEGLQSGRQWLVGASTLLASYTPERN